MARRSTMLPPPMSPGGGYPVEQASRTYTTTMSSPVGELVLIAGDGGLRAVLWPGEEELTAGAVHVDRDDMRTGTAPDDHAIGILTRTVEQLSEYFDGRRRHFDLPLDPVGTDFQKAAWMVLRGIPYGRTITYGDQARLLGDPNKARAVGSANGRNPISIIVPCHRVIGADGSLTGYGGGTEIKEWLLRHERGATSPPLPFD